MFSFLKYICCRKKNRSQSLMLEMQNSLRYCQVGMDIGGTLTKIVCVIPNNTNKNDGDSVVGCLLKYGIVYKIIQSNLRTI